MRDDRVDGVQSTIAELMGSSVGRRWLLKAGFGAGAAAWVMPSWAAAATGRSPLGGLIAGVGPSETRVFHFALGAAAEVDDLTLHVNGQVVPLSPHTPLTRMRLLGQGSLWRKLRRGRLTHFAEVEVPAERGLLASVRGIETARTWWWRRRSMPRWRARGRWPRRPSRWRGRTGWWPARPSGWPDSGCKPRSSPRCDEVVDLDTRRRLPSDGDRVDDVPSQRGHGRAHRGRRPPSRCWARPPRSRRSATRSIRCSRPARTSPPWSRRSTPTATRARSRSGRRPSPSRPSS